MPYPIIVAVVLCVIGISRFSLNGDCVALFPYVLMFSNIPANVVHVSGTGQLLTNPPVAGLRLSPGKSTRRALV